MRVKTIEVRRFRCVLDDRIECDRFTSIVGRNGVGKSCFLNALRIFYAVNPTLTVEDFYNRQTNDPIEIRVTFTDLLPEEQAKFETYLDGGELIVTKRIRCVEGAMSSKTYAAPRQYPAFAAVRAIDGKAAQKEAFNQLVESGSCPGLERAASAGQAEDRMRAWEAANRALCQPTERETQFIGPASIGVGALDTYTKAVFIPAVRDAADEVSDGRGSALAALLDLVVNERVDAREDLRALRDHLRENWTNIFGAGSQPELSTLSHEISGLLSGFHPGAGVELSWNAARPPELALPQVEPSVIEDGFKGNITRKGHGLQRAIVLALLQARANTAMRASATSGNGGPESSGTRRQLILVVEEPELYQHPQQCRHWAKLLRKITAVDANNQADTQVLLTTHSPHFVDLSWFDQVRLIRKRQGEGEGPRISKVHYATLDKVAAALAAATGRRAEDCTALSTRSRGRAVMSRATNEGFFAHVVVLVEGNTEVGILQELARIRGKEWDAQGISVIDVGGKSNLLTPWAIFRSLDIPVYLVFDADVQRRGKGNGGEEANRTRQNQELLRALNVAVEDYPIEGAYSAHAVVGKEAAAHLRDSLGDLEFTRIAGGVATDLGYPGSSDAMKNVDGVALFTARAYAEGKRFHFFESVVDRITELAVMW